MCSDSEKNMSAFADQNHAPSLTCVRLENCKKVVYKKNVAKATESNAIKRSSYYDSDHEEAYHGAWGLNVDIERYVNGRRVGVASPSEATFNTYVQLDKEDVDMMDYQLFAISEDDDGELIIDPVTMSDDPEETGGLFTFTAQAGMRYLFYQ